MSVSNDSLTRGLFQTPKYIPDSCMWASDNGQKLYDERKKSVSFYKLEDAEILSCTRQVAPDLPDKLVIIDLGSGLSPRNTMWLETIVRGKPEVQICYIPIDIADVVLDFTKFINETCPGLIENVVHIQPIVGDMKEILENLDDILNETEYKDWPKLFALFGPNIGFLRVEDTTEIIKIVGNHVQESDGGFCLTYIPDHENWKDNLMSSFYDQLDLKMYLKGFMAGFCKLSGLPLKPDLFDYKLKFLHKHPIDQCSGTFDGVVHHARAKQDISFQCGGQEIFISKEEIIRMSSDVVQFRLYSQEAVESLSMQGDLRLSNSTLENGKLFTCNFYKAKV